MRLQPGDQTRGFMTDIAQRLQQAHDEWRRARRLRAQKSREWRVPLCRPALALNLDELSAAALRLTAVFPGFEHLLGKAAQVFDQAEAQVV